MESMLEQAMSNSIEVARGSNASLLGIQGQSGLPAKSMKNKLEADVVAIQLMLYERIGEGLGR